MSNKLVFFIKFLKDDKYFDKDFYFYKYELGTLIFNNRCRVPLLDYFTDLTNDGDFYFAIEEIEKSLKNFNVNSYSNKSVIGFVNYGDIGNLENFSDYYCTVVKTINHRENNAVENFNYKIPINKIDNIKSAIRDIKIKEIINE